MAVRSVLSSLARTSGVAVLALALAACAAGPESKRLYTGAERASAEVANIHLDGFQQPTAFLGMGYLEWVELRALDGIAIEQTTRAARDYQVLPGKHTLTVRYGYEASSGAQGLLESLISEAMREAITKRFQKEFTLDAKAGGSYAVKYRVDEHSAFTPVTSWTVQLWVEEGATGEVVAGTRPAGAAKPSG